MKYHSDSTAITEEMFQGNELKTYYARLLPEIKQKIRKSYYRKFKYKQGSFYHRLNNSLMTDLEIDFIKGVAQKEIEKKK